MWAKIQNNLCERNVCECVCAIHLSYMGLRLWLWFAHWNADTANTLQCYRIMCSHKIFTPTRTHSQLRCFSSHANVFAYSFPPASSVCLLLFPFRSFIWLSKIVHTLVTHRNGSECKVTFMCVYSEDVYMCEAYMGVSECERWNGEHRPTNRRTSDWVRPRIACTHTHAYNSKTRMWSRATAATTTTTTTAIIREHEKSNSNSRKKWNVKLVFFQPSFVCVYQFLEARLLATAKTITTEERKINISNQQNKHKQHYGERERAKKNWE